MKIPTKVGIDGGGFGGYLCSVILLKNQIMKCITDSIFNIIF